MPSSFRGFGDSSVLAQGSEFIEKTDVKTKFKAAVELVQSLPKESSFQPSYEDASKVYGYFKQSNFGPCKDPKPSFLYVIQRAKWEAWSCLGDMPREEAMERYVQEIRKQYEKFTKVPEFESRQVEFASTLIPFCKVNGIALPDKIQQLEDTKKKKDKQSHLPNGMINGKMEDGSQKPTNINQHEDSNNEELDRHEVRADEEVFQENVSLEKLLSKDNRHEDVSDHSHSFLINGINGNGSCNGNHGVAPIEENDVILIKPKPKSHRVSENEAEENGLNDRTINESQSGEESSEEDIYCDSLDPDQVPEIATHLQSVEKQPSEVITENSSESDAQNLTNVTQGSSLLVMEDTPISKVNVAETDFHSTPLSRYEYAFVTLNTKEESFGVKDEHWTDPSTLSSASNNSPQNRSPKASSGNRSSRRRLKYLEERKLCEELERPRISHQSIGSPSFKLGISHGKDDKDKQKRQLVRRARGSENDLTGKERSGSRNTEQSPREQPQAPPTISGTRMPSSRSRENEKENDSDTSGSSNIENVGEDETIGDRIVNALERLQQDMRMVILRLNSIEDRIKAATQHERSWWVRYVPSKTVLLLVLWPIFVNIVFSYWRRRKRK